MDERFIAIGIFLAFLLILFYYTNANKKEKIDMVDNSVEQKITDDEIEYYDEIDDLYDSIYKKQLELWST